MSGRARLAGGVWGADGVEASGIRVGHCRGHGPAEFLRPGEVSGRRQPRRGLDHAGQHCRLRERQILGLAVEIMPRCRAQAIDVVAEIDVRQITRQDLVLRQPCLEPEGDQHLAQLAPGGAVRIEERVLGELLGDRATAFTHTAAREIMEKGARDAARIDPPMRAEATILDGEEGVRRDIVLLNSGAALYVAGAADSIADGVRLAAESIDSGAAGKKLQAFIEATASAK